MTPGSRIRSPGAERIVRVTQAFVFGVALIHGAALAHGDATPVIPPEARGWFDASASLSIVSADDRWPAASLTGVLGDGSSEPDRRSRGWLDEAAIGAGLRLTPGLAAYAALGWHGRDPAHVEALKLVAEGSADDGLVPTLTLGRDGVPLGEVIATGTLSEAIAGPALAVRAVFGERPVDDGVQARWQSTGRAGALSLGLWRGRAFPGGGGTKPVPSLLVETAGGPVEIGVFAAHFDVDGRGALTQTVALDRHLHGAPDCRVTVADLLCFSGRSTVLGLSGRTGLDAERRFVLTAALLARLESGTLSSRSGEAAYDGTTVGGWLALQVVIESRWNLNMRIEHLRPRNHLSGVGAAALAREAGMTTQGSHGGLAVALSRRLRDDFVASVEVGASQQPGGTSRYALLRLNWRARGWRVAR